MSRPSHPKLFTPDQLQQHQELGYQLQRVNAMAAQWLIQFDRLNPAHKHFEDVCSELANVAGSMNLITACCERIAASGCRQPYTRINVLVGRTCDFCLANPECGRDTASQDDPFKRLAPDPGWKVQVDALFSITTLATNRMLERASFYPREMKRSALCLHDLSQAIRRQQTHLDGIGTRHTTEIRQIDDFDRKVCRTCGNPYPASRGPAISG
jgi:hypothetical protein